MEGRDRLFALAIGATRLNPDFEQECLEGGNTLIFRRTKKLPTPADGMPPAPGPIQFRVGAIAIVANNEKEARRQALRVAREIFPQSDGWIGHHAYATEIAELKTYKKGFG